MKRYALSVFSALTLAVGVTTCGANSQATVDGERIATANCEDQLAAPAPAETWLSFVELRNASAHGQFIPPFQNAQHCSSRCMARIQQADEPL